MKQFNKNKAIKKINLQQNKSTYIKRLSIALSCLFLLICAILFTFAKFEANSNIFSLILGNVHYELTTTVDKIFLGTTETNVLPEAGNGWEFDNAVCTNGATATWDDANWQLNTTYQGKKTTCNLYFKQYFVLRGNANNINSTLSSYNSTSNVIDKGHNSTFAYDRTTDNNLRYVGANPNNYVQFNNELWRIIGVMNNIYDNNNNKNTVLKIIRAESIGEYSWDTSNSSINSGYGINEWSQADLYNLLNNGHYWNRTSGNCYNGTNNATISCDFSNIGLTNTSKAMIYNATWNTSTLNGSWWTQDDKGNASQIYIDERGNNAVNYCTDSGCDGIVRKTKVVGNVGLIYPSDYGFATNGSNTLSRNECLSVRVHSYTNGCNTKDWLSVDGDPAWLITPRARYYYAAFSIFKSGNLDDVYTGIDMNDIGNHNQYTSDNRNVFPVVYLKTSISIIGGDGSSTRPYILE